MVFSVASVSKKEGTEPPKAPAAQKSHFPSECLGMQRQITNLEAWLITWIQEKGRCLTTRFFHNVTIMYYICIVFWG